jgi:hypothetical protein
VRIKFFSKDYIEMSIPKELAFENKDPPAHAPDIFEYVGVGRDREKWKTERKGCGKKRRKTAPLHLAILALREPIRWGSGIKDGGNTLIPTLGISPSPSEILFV